MAEQTGACASPWQIGPDGRNIWTVAPAGGGISVVDITGTPAERLPPTPNCVILRVVADQAAFDAVPAQAKPGIIYRDPSAGGVFLSTTNQDGVMAAAELAALKTYLSQIGFTAAHIDEAIPAAETLTRRQIADHLAAWLRMR